ncbi:hypothetical protein BC936DRAFT_150143 [Jimgerdemannia flammicorona]|uniref:Uncharacterized protein n=2 Tax=Jimgerdemannia flammicorona TaxID=994334 RepID=A0A433CZE7_9FUNG|nr:hypothetical protein BC936DRAFT_150143 [Jimgerdemannia flammicorona]RUS25779.1 hypothetical protein BC938DRAFT_471676 [Jimgerdemannia flammicorona]
MNSQRFHIIREFCVWRLPPMHRGPNGTTSCRTLHNGGGSASDDFVAIDAYCHPLPCETTGVDSVGIYRLSGSTTSIQRFRAQFNAGWLLY